MTNGQRWWEGTVFYEIYVASFQDSNADGIGDFNGLTSRLDYLEELGVGGVWLTPFYPSPRIDNGYDVSDYFDVDPDFGSLADFDRFIKEAHHRGIKVIIDMVFNHVSSEHPWFKDAISDPASKYRDYFVFEDQPNGWESFFGGSAWTKEPNGEQYFYHKFSPQQADLNWQNEDVVSEMNGVLQFWLDRGVDGFRLDVINFLCCDGIGEENERDDQGKQIHRHDIDQDGILSCVESICTFSRDYSAQIGLNCFLVGEVGHDELSKLALYQGKNLLDVVFNFNLGSIGVFDVNSVYEQLQEMERSLSGPPTIFFNSHDMPRSMSRLCSNDLSFAAAIAALELTARGVCFLYYGEEIGMPDFCPGDIEQIRDVSAIQQYELAVQSGKSAYQSFATALDHCRDKSRLYMQWDASKYAGFSAGEPWIGPADNEAMPSVQDAKADPDSLWHWYHKLISIRNSSSALQYGKYDGLELEEQVLRISRSWESQRINVLINFSGVERPVALAGSYKVLAARGLLGTEDCRLAPWGTLITSEKLNAS